MGTGRKYDGGSVYPRKIPDRQEYTYGLSIREHFASLASEEDIAAHRSLGRQTTETATREEAKFAYADAMIKARDR